MVGIGAVCSVAALVGCSTMAPSPAGEVFLAAASEQGVDPFTPNAASAAVQLNAMSSATPAPAASGQVSSVTGTTPRVYAGEPKRPACDVDAIWNALKGDAGKLASWAGVIGISTGQVEAYLRGAAPVVLRSDTRVTNHTLGGGQARPFQYVLQAGTAVLVDSVGLPRVRCACGNPLAPPAAVSGEVKYVGTQWPGFNPALLVVIVAGPQVPSLTVVNVIDGTDFQVPVSTPGTTSPSASASATATGSPQATTTQRPTPKPTAGTPTPATYTNCAQQYAQLVKELTLANKLTPADAQRWAALAQQAAQAAQSGNLVQAYQICVQTVGEMEQALGS